MPIAGELACQRRQRRAHEDRRRCEREHREHESQERKQDRLAFDRAEDAAIDLMEQPERDGRREDHNDKHELDETVQTQRRSHPVRQPTAEEAPYCHPTEEAGQNRRDRLGRVAEDKHELA